MALARWTLVDNPYDNFCTFFLFLTQPVSTPYSLVLFLQNVYLLVCCFLVFIIFRRADFWVLQRNVAFLSSLTLLICFFIHYLGLSFVVFVVHCFSSLLLFSFFLKSIDFWVHQKLLICSFSLLDNYQHDIFRLIYYILQLIIFIFSNFAFSNIFIYSFFKTFAFLTIFFIVIFVQ